MIRTMLFAGAAALCLAPAAQAQYHNGYDNGYYQSAQKSGCEREQDSNRLVGGLIGAVAGGALGVAIADDNDDHYRGRRHYRGHRGYRGYRGHHGYRHNNDGDEIAGALIGGVLGAVIGSELAASGTDCRRTVTNNYSYRAMNVAPPTRQAFATANPQPVSSQQPYAYGNPGEQLYGGPASNAGPREPIRVTRTQPEPQPAYAPTCRTVQRETRLPDGQVVREPISVCQDSNGQWNMQDGESRY